MEQKIALKNPWYNRTIVAEQGLHPLVMDGLSVIGTIEKAQEIINDDHLSNSDSAVVKDLILVADIMKDRLSKNSKNSSQPPSQDELKDKNKQKKPKLKNCNYSIIFCTLSIQGANGKIFQLKKMH